MYSQKQRTASQASGQLYCRLPPEVLASICEHLDGFSTQMSFALCSKSNYAIAIPSLYREVKLLSIVAQTRFAYAVALHRSKEGRGQHVTSMEVALPVVQGGSVDWHKDLLIMIVARCSAVKFLILNRPSQDSHGYACSQADINALSSVVSANQNLQGLTINLATRMGPRMVPYGVELGFSSERKTIQFRKKSHRCKMVTI